MLHVTNILSIVVEGFQLQVWQSSGDQGLGCSAPDWIVLDRRSLRGFQEQSKCLGWSLEEEVIT